jgi:SnoaL-like domain
MLAFRRAVEAGDLDRIGELFAEDVVLHSPIAYRPYQGREMVAKIVNIVATIFEDFAYQREIGAETDDDHALVFGARVGELSIQGCDFLHTNADGMIDELTVMLRPLRAAQAFQEQMSAKFAAAMADASDQHAAPQ